MCFTLSCARKADCAYESRFNSLGGMALPLTMKFRGDECRWERGFAPLISRRASARQSAKLR